MIHSPAPPEPLPSHGGVDRQRDDRLGRASLEQRLFGQQRPGQRRTLQSHGRHLDENGTSGGPPGRERHTAVWTGSEMIIWGGNDRTTGFNDTFSYFPGSNLFFFLSP